MLLLKDISTSMTVVLILTHLCFSPPPPHVVFDCVQICPHANVFQLYLGTMEGFIALPCPL